MAKVVVQPAFEPVTLAEAKLHTRLDHELEDGLIQTWITSGRIMAENYQNRAYLEQTIEVVRDRFPPRGFSLPKPPLISLESFKCYDEEGDEHELPIGDFHIDTHSEPGRVFFDGEYPSIIKLRPINGVVIRFKAGNSTAEEVPRHIKDAILAYVTYRYYNREAEGDNPPPQFFWLLAFDRVVPA